MIPEQGPGKGGEAQAWCLRYSKLHAHTGKVQYPGIIEIEAVWTAPTPLPLGLKLIKELLNEIKESEIRYTVWTARAESPHGRKKRKQQQHNEHSLLGVSFFLYLLSPIFPSPSPSFFFPLSVLTVRMTERSSTRDGLIRTHYLPKQTRTQAWQ